MSGSAFFWDTASSYTVGVNLVPYAVSGSK